MKINTITLVTALLAVAALSSAQTPGADKTGSTAPYTEGPVWTITFVKTKSGMGDEYLKQISQTVKPVMEAEKAQKLILDYKVLQGDAMGPNDANILIMARICQHGCPRRFAGQG